MHKNREIFIFLKKVLKKHKTLSEMQFFFRNALEARKILDCFEIFKSFFELLESIWKVFGLSKQHIKGSGML